MQNRTSKAISQVKTNAKEQYFSWRGQPSSLTPHV
jgi:hypothetical protein